jgi:hypothetical protein
MKDYISVIWCFTATCAALFVAPRSRPKPPHSATNIDMSKRGSFASLVHTVWQKLGGLHFLIYLGAKLCPPDCDRTELRIMVGSAGADDLQAQAIVRL